VRPTVSYEVLVAVVVINALVTLSLWRQMANKVNRVRLNEKGTKALWRCDPIVPRHDPPKAVGADFSSAVRDVDRTFFEDFKEFADVVNWSLAEDEYWRFRLQDLPDTVLRLDVPHDMFPPPLGRCFKVYHNQLRVGRVEIGPSHGYATETPLVRTSVRIDLARFLGCRAITDFLRTIASYVTNSNRKSDEGIDAEQCIQVALMGPLWEDYGHPDYEVRGELNVTFHGSAEWYLARRTAWRNAVATNKVNAERAPKR
jgi:hypothetical protein